MRTRWTSSLVAALALAACTPEVTPGAYLCGPEQLCPDGLACNGPDAVCVLASAALPFACDPDTNDVEPNDALATAQPLFGGAAACVTPVAEVLGCLPGDDAGDWYRFASVDNCTAVGIDARIVFSTAFEALTLELLDADGAVVATGVPCINDPADDGETRVCLRTPLTPGAPYALRVEPSAEGACGGACAYNRYSLTVGLETP